MPGLKMRWRRAYGLSLAALAAGCCCAWGENPVTSPDPRLTPLLRTLRPAEAKRVQPQDGCFHGLPAPDGTSVAHLYESPLPPDAEGGQAPRSLRLYSREGRLLRDLTYGKFHWVGSFSWSHTSRALYFWVEPDFEEPGRGGVWKIDLRNDTILRPQLPWMPEPGTTVPIWSPRGDSYLAETSRRRPDGTILSKIHRIQMSTGRSRVLGAGYGPVWSPDGRWILFIRSSFSDGRVVNDRWVMRSDGSQAHPVLTERDRDVNARRRAFDAAGDSGPAAWIAGTDRLMLSGAMNTDPPVRKEGRTQLGAWRLDAGRPGVQWLPLPGLWVTSASADGRHFYVQTRTRDGRPENNWYLITRSVGRR